MSENENVAPAGETQPTPAPVTTPEPATTHEPEALSMEDAVALLDEEDRKAAGTPRDDSGKFTRKAREGDEPEAQVDAPDDAPELDETSDGEAEEESGDEVSIIDGNAETRLRDGRKIKVAELKKAYDEAEQIRRAAPEIQKFAENLRVEAQRIAQQKAEFEQLIANYQLPQNAVPQPPHPELLHTDPIEYLQQKETYEAAVRQQQWVQQQQQQAAAQRQQQSRAQLQDHMAKQAEQLVKKAPEFKDPKAAQQFQKEFIETAKSYGFDDREASNVYDHRLLLMVRDLARYRKEANSAPQAIEQARARAQQARPAEASAKARVPAATRKAEQTDALWKRAKSSGSFEDVLRLANTIDP